MKIKHTCYKCHAQTKSMITRTDLTWDWMCEKCEEKQYKTKKVKEKKDGNR